MKRRIMVCLLAIVLALTAVFPVFAASVPRKDTPDYKVAFYAFDCYHMQDEDGRRYGYGYEMMQGLSRYLQCTFSYVGYDKTAAESIEMLRNGEVDLYTAAKKTPEREAEFAFSTHPCITATTCMNVKVGNTKVVPGDYSTYQGLRIGFLKRHTYNDSFLEFAREKGFDCEFLYYDTPTELSNALISGEVDALVNSYIRIPDDETVIENFGQTPYYMMARKEDQALIDGLDRAMDRINVDTPNWRTDLYNKYYGSQNTSTDFTSDEMELLDQMRADGVTIRAIMNPTNNPYAWYEKGEAHGAAADMFRAVADELGLGYEFVPVEDAAEYEKKLAAGEADVWLDSDCYYEDEDYSKYKQTSSYLTTTVSLLRRRGTLGKIRSLAVMEDNIPVKRIIESFWKNATIQVIPDTEECLKAVLNGEVDGALLMTYTAQKLASDEIQNRVSVEIVPGASLELKMGINAAVDSRFYGIWAKTLAKVSQTKSSEILQAYMERTENQTLLRYLFDNPAYLAVLIIFALALVFFILLYILALRSRQRQRKISLQLSEALTEARAANQAKLNFFSRMSHDIRTPLNVVLGMTQIAMKYKNDAGRLETALSNITTEGRHLLVLINSILDVNQLESGHIDLLKEPFNPAECVKSCAKMLHPLAKRKHQSLMVQCDREDRIVLGDANRLVQILINIVSNAIKYTDEGGHITLRLECLPEDRYRFTCTDDGIGMSKEFIKHIFEDYTRAEDSRISKIQGTGLGMSVVKGFTDLMNGSLDIQSEPGKGSSIAVEIAFPEASERQKEVTQEISGEKTEKPMKFTGKKVLLVEDNSLNAEIATELLQSIGFAVDWAENGKAGVDRFLASEPEEYFAVFMDMQMPVMDGVEATREMRSSGRPDCDIPIFAMTANTFISDRDSCREAGMNGYICKPINLSEIVATLQECVTG